MGSGTCTIIKLGYICIYSYMGDNLLDEQRLKIIFQIYYICRTHIFIFKLSIRAAKFTTRLSSISRLGRQCNYKHGTSLRAPTILTNLFYVPHHVYLF